MQSATIYDFYIPLGVSVLFLGIILAFGYVLFKNKSKNFKAYLFFLIWFLLGLMFHAQIFPLDMTVAERWFYFPFAGLLGIAGLMWSNFYQKRGWQVIVPFVFVVLFVLIILLLSVRTFLRNFDWKDNMTLFSKDSKASQSANLEFNLAVSLLDAKKKDEAKIHLGQAISLTSNKSMKAYYKGTLYGIEGDYEQARTSMLEAIKIDKSPLAYAAVSNMIYLNGTYEEAMEFVQSGLKEAPENGQLWLNFALLLYEKGNRSEAVDAAKRAFELSPTKDGEYVLRQIEKNQPVY